MTRGASLLLIGAVLALAVPGRDAHGQTPSPSPAGGTSTSRPDALWRCELPGGVYLVALRSIASISSHEYTVDGAARVTEVTVATNSSVEARFYYLEPATINPAPGLSGTAELEALQQRVYDTAAAQAGNNDAVWQKVIKNYPTTTHAHTVEYRLESKQNLQQLYSSLEQAWTTGKGINLTTQ